MTVLWPWLLLTLLLVPILVGLYIWNLRRKRKFAVRFSNVSLIRAAVPKRSRWRQHLPFVLFLLGVSSLLLAMSRPASVIEVPLSRTSIILALDVSRSMCATDVPPNRLTVAQEAALEFIDEQADGTKMGIVAFAGFAEIIVPPTNDKEQLTSAIENLTTSLGTAIGSATLKSIDAIAEINEAVEFSAVNLGDRAFDQDLDNPIYQPDIIVLLTDGANSQGIFPLDAALLAAERQVRVFTIGFGTDNPTEMVCTGQQIGSDAFSGGFGNGGGFGGGGFGGGNFGGFRQFLVIDEQTLQDVAMITGGEYYRAENSDQLFDIFRNLPTEITLQEQETEISFVFSLIGAVFVLVSVGLSLRWNRFP
ncbi:MAG: VWA domain-containing protein [Chloroflexota bacterium]